MALRGMSACTLVLVALDVAGHVVGSVFAWREAAARADEWNQAIARRASQNSSYVPGAGVVLALAVCLLNQRAV